MTSVELSTGRQWDPAHPATRIYISGFEYKLVAPYSVVTTLASTIKLIWNWIAPAGRAVKNIMYALAPPAADTTDVAYLGAVASALKSAISSSNLLQGLSNDHYLAQITAKDNSGGSDNQVTTTGASIPGGTAQPTLSPQCAVVISWAIDANYRGGKPRTYLPGVHAGWQVTPGDSQLVAGTCHSLAASADAMEATFNAASPGGHDTILGTISFRTHNAPRPTPIFRPFGQATVHERMDSQRRRNGKEAAFGVTP